jgi:hypothetical protein
LDAQADSRRKSRTEQFPAYTVFIRTPWKRIFISKQVGENEEPGVSVIYCRQFGLAQQRDLSVQLLSSDIFKAYLGVKESLFRSRRDASSRYTTAAAAGLAGATLSDLIIAEQVGMHAGTARSRPILTSLPLQIFIYFGGWWDLLFWVLSTLVFVYKGEWCG